MGRTRRRATSWEPADADFSVTTVGTTTGEEIINGAQVAAWAPATLVRVRGSILGQLNSQASGGNNPGLIELQIRKVSLESINTNYAATSEQIDAPGNLANEDILWTGVLHFRSWGYIQSSGVYVSNRPVDFVSVDISAKRRFQSAEERLVLEAMPLSGDGSNVRIVGMLRALFMAG